uniref:(northern house mosquito) hypothetical protein n=1 Tax=Culex pipiens TaxID=7175 RepID=A0A8D8B3A3_CULPI
MDQFVRSYLKQWELEELIPRFEDEEINERAFKCLSDDIIKELIPKLGKRAIFSSAYKEFLETLKTKPEPVDCKIESTSSTSIKQEPSKLEETPDPSQNAPSAPNIDEVSEHPEAHSTSPESPPPLETFSIAPLTDLSAVDHETAQALRNLLEQSPTASHLRDKKFLTRSSRNLLSEEIVYYLYFQNNGALTEEVLANWARAVEVVFKDEVAAIYYRKQQRGGGAELGTGKLCEYYQRMK